MKRLIPILLLPILLVSATTNDGYRRLPSNAFGAGEKILYRVHYGFVTAGEAELSIDKKIHTINDRPCYKIDIHGRTTGLADKLFNVKDNWGTYLDTAAMAPHQFYRHIREGKYRKNEMVHFQQLNRKAVVSTLSKNGRDIENTEVFNVPSYVQDLISGYYYLRTLDYTHTKTGEILKVDAFFDKEVYDFKVRFLGREKVKTEMGRIDALVLTPILPDNKLFKGENAVRIWISDDENKIPLKIKAEMMVGAVEIDIRDFQKSRRR
jgi:hypothetical protein